MESFIHGDIDEFIEWKDVDGNIINASDGGVIFVDGKYHWYGQALRPLPDRDGAEGGQKNDLGVVMYVSEDLLNWKYEGVILSVSNDENSELYAPMRFERPKIIYNEKTKQFVLWCHYVKFPGNHGITQGTAEAGIAVCDTVNGKYRWLGTCRPIDDKGLVRDCSLYKDHNEDAYFIYDREVDKMRYLHVVKLSEDYLSPTDKYSRIDTAFRREAPAIVFHNDTYYIVTSGMSGWTPNQALAYRTKNLLDQWEIIGDPCVDDYTHTTFNSQSTFAFPIEGKDDMFIMMFERHNTANFEKCSYVWLPVEFDENDTISIRYRKEWKL